MNILRKPEVGLRKKLLDKSTKKNRYKDNKEFVASQARAECDWHLLSEPIVILNSRCHGGVKVVSFVSLKSLKW